MQADLTALWRPARAMNERDLAEIYTTLSPRLFRYAYRFLGDATESEEVVAETFHRFLSALRRDQGPQQHLSGYLYRILHNIITDRFRRQPPPDLPLEDDLAVDGDLAQMQASRAEQARARALLQHLTPEQRFVVSCKFLEGLSNDEIAAALGKNVGTVKALQHRGLEALRRALTREGWSSEGALS